MALLRPQASVHGMFTRISEGLLGVTGAGTQVLPCVLENGQCLVARLRMQGIGIVLCGSVDRSHEQHEHQTMSQLRRASAGHR
jgi:hypothetical protein